MTCSSCNAKILKQLEDIRRKNPTFPRPDLYRDLIYRGGSLYYAAAPRDIPEDVRTVRTPYGIMPVLHLELRVCDDGTLTDQVDWGGVNAGSYLTDRGYLIVRVHEDIPKSAGARPLERVINTGLAIVRYLGTTEAEWEYKDGKVVRAEYPLDDELGIVTYTVVEDAPTVTEKQVLATYEERIAKLEELLALVLKRDAVGE